MALEEQRLEISLNQAIALKRLTGDETVKDDYPAGRRLSIKLICAIHDLEDAATKPHPIQTYSLWLREPELWLINSLVFEESKDMQGASLRPFLRDVWRLLREFHADDVLQAPETPAAEPTVEDLSYRALKAKRLQELGE